MGEHELMELFGKAEGRVPVRPDSGVTRDMMYEQFIKNQPARNHQELEYVFAESDSRLLRSVSPSLTHNVLPQEGLPQSAVDMTLPWHIRNVIDEHVTRINSCYFQILGQVRQAFNAEHPLITIDSILIHFATIFIAYYLTFAISPSFMDVLAPSGTEHKDVTRSALEFWREKLESHYKTLPTTPVSFDEFNRTTELALNFVWWSHNFEEVCRHGMIQQPLAEREVKLVGNAMLSELRNLPNEAEDAPMLDQGSYRDWRTGSVFRDHYDVPKVVRYLSTNGGVVVYKVSSKETKMLVVVKEFRIGLNIEYKNAGVPRAVY